ncbi:chemotaxis protein CheW [Burkholderia alba]|uniref:chemotaxis protein CheW n=1 Tax=Burkholderia alba TaxID=2683677 RepID=UPI002B05786D|nr:chemotaxis protein CheW [Burkholderia alba]
MDRDAVESPDTTLDVDDCWNRIGTRGGDQSCPRLDEYSRCLNCPVFAKNAAVLLDRPLTGADLSAAARLAGAASPSLATGGPARGETDETLHSVLAFRVADEWLALPTGVLREITDTRSIHSLPHRRNRAVLGIVNVRGTLRIAVSLAELLHLDARADQPGTRSGFTRMLVVAHGGEPVVFPVDEVEGVLRFTPSEWVSVPAAVSRASVTHSRGVFVWRGKAIGLLDEDRLFDSLIRSLR